MKVRAGVLLSARAAGAVRKDDGRAREEKGGAVLDTVVGRLATEKCEAGR